MRTAFRLAFSLSVLLLLIPQALALSVSVGDINDIDDVRDLRDEVEDELEDDCRFDDHHDLRDDIEDIYDEARDEAPSSLDDDLDRDEDDLIDDLEDMGCDGFGTGHSPFGYNTYSFPRFGFGAFPRTTVTPIYTGFGGMQPLCFNGFGTVYPTLMNTVPGYGGFGDTACTPFGGFSGFSTYSGFPY